MALKLAFNPITAQFDLVQDLSSLDTTYAKLDGTNQPFTGDVKLDTLKSKSILATDANGKIIEGSFPSEADTLATVTTRGATTTNRITTGNITVTDDGSASLTVNAVPAETYGTGGDTITNVTVGLDTYRIHKFTTVGNATFVAPSPARNVEVLVVAGGGGGGVRIGGGGGAGGVVYHSALSTASVQSIGVTVGNGGAGGVYEGTRSGGSGGNSVFGSITALGGGGGGAYQLRGGIAGGSGGGGTYNGISGGAKTQGDSGGGIGYGSAGGNGINNAGYSAGGGGATGAGGNGNAPEYGGNGYTSTISGSSVCYAGGGNGCGITTGGNGVACGGGAGSGNNNNSASSATPNTGGGGGGARDSSDIAGVKGGNGGSGVVIVKYLISNGATEASPEVKLQGTSLDIWKIKSDGADSHKLKTSNASGTVVSTLDQSGNQIFAGAVQATDATLTGLTLGSVPFVGTGGLLSQDNTKLFWDDTNKRLGIGTKSPIANLHVVGTIRATNNIISARGAGFRSSDGYEGVYLLAGGNLKLRTNTTDNAIYLLDTGNVGIGNATPDRKLTVTDISGSAQIRLSYDAANYAEIRGGATGALYFTSSKGFTYFNAAGKDNKFYAYDYSSIGSPYLYLSAHTLRLNAGMIAGWGTVNLNDNGDSFLTGGNVGIGTTSPKAVLHLKAGTSTASTAPLKFTSGTLLGTAEAGAVEFLSDDFFATITTGAARKGIILDDGSRLTSGKIPVATTNGRLVDLTAQDTEADLKVDYTSGDLDTEAKVITAINATNAKINSIIEKLKALGLLATS